MAVSKNSMTSVISHDQKVFRLSVKAASMSVVWRDALSLYGPEITIPVNIAANHVLGIVVQYCINYDGIEPPDDVAFLPNVHVNNYDRELLGTLHHESLIGVLICARYLIIDSLYETCLKLLSEYCCGLTTRQLQKKFRIKRYTREEHKEILRGGGPKRNSNHFP